MTNFELAVRVPLLMRVPWRPGSIGRRYAKATYYLLTTYGLLRTTCYRSARIVEIVSLYQTIAELAGLPPPAERLQGKSFASTFGAEAAAGQAGLAAAAAAAAGGGRWRGGRRPGRGRAGRRWRWRRRRSSTPSVSLPSRTSPPQSCLDGLSCRWGQHGQKWPDVLASAQLTATVPSYVAAL